MEKEKYKFDPSGAFLIEGHLYGGPEATNKAVHLENYKWLSMGTGGGWRARPGTWVLEHEGPEVPGEGFRQGRRREMLLLLCVSGERCQAYPKAGLWE